MKFEVADTAIRRPARQLGAMFGALNFTPEGSRLLTEIVWCDSGGAAVANAANRYGFATLRVKGRGIILSGVTEPLALARVAGVPGDDLTTTGRAGAHTLTLDFNRDAHFATTCIVSSAIDTTHWNRNSIAPTDLRKPATPVGRAACRLSSTCRG
jgi:hypothetical protein